MDPYKILELPRNFTLEQLKHNYKKLALKLHPDKSQINSDYLFKIVTGAYKTLLKELDTRQADKQFNQLKNASLDFSRSQSKKTPTPLGFSRGSGEQFNIEKFNSVFDNTRLDDPTNIGYGHWMAKSDVKREEINVQNNVGKYDTNKFNQIFDKQPVGKERKITVFKEPEALVSTKKMGYSDLGLTTVNDFSGDNLTNKALNYTDYKIAHTTSRLVDQSARVRTDFKNVEDLKCQRSSISFQMNEREQKEYAKQKAVEEERELKRRQNLSRYDQSVFKQYEDIHKLLLR